MRRLAFIVLAAAACSSHSDSVCNDIGYCRSLSDQQIGACQKEAKSLAREAKDSGCSLQFDAYFSCADDRYQCRGNTPVFPGCETARSALDDCLGQARSPNACGQLARLFAQCPGGTPEPSLLPTPCGAAELCAVRCYLDAVPDVCRPKPTELVDASRCAQTCPF